MTDVDRGRRDGGAEAQAQRRQHPWLRDRAQNSVQPDAQGLATKAASGMSTHEAQVEQNETERGREPGQDSKPRANAPGARPQSSLSSREGLRALYRGA